MLILAILSGVIALLWYESPDPPLVEPMAATTQMQITEPRSTLPDAQIESLDLKLPEHVLQTNPELDLQAPPSLIKPLFKPTEKQTVVSVGGGLIMEEDPAPETPLKDQVKGVRIDVEVKID